MPSNAKPLPNNADLENKKNAIGKKVDQHMEKNNLSTSSSSSSSPFRLKRFGN